MFSKLLRLLARRPQVITIDLIARDRLDLGMKIVNLNDEQCAALSWSQQERKKLYEALIAHSPKGYDGWHPTDEELFSVRLTQSEWGMVERLCSDLVSAEADGWPERVLSRIQANAV